MGITTTAPENANFVRPASNRRRRYNQVTEITALIGDEPKQRSFKGREAWALNELARAAGRGVTPITNPGPRWSHYVFKLKRSGIGIKTIRENHGGPFAGSHARYRLETPVQIVTRIFKGAI